MKFIEDSALKYLSVKLPFLGAFLMILLLHLTPYAKLLGATIRMDMKIL